jgi:hypothetical protein
MTPGPKLAANPIIHSRIASVKIVQNTALLLNGYKPEKLAVSLRFNRPERPFRSWASIQHDHLYVVYRAYTSDPFKRLRVVCTLVPKGHFLR